MSILIARLSISGNVWTTYDYFQNITVTPRPPQSVKVGIQTGLSFYWLTLNLNVLFNSTDRFNPQTTSTYGITPSWSWGRIYFGDFSPSFSPLVLNGLIVRGYGIDIHPNPFRLFLVTGSARTTDIDTLDFEVNRDVKGLHLRVGNIGIEFLRIYDKSKEESLPVPLNGNLVTGFSFKLNANKLHLRGNLNGSIHTYDIGLRTEFKRKIPEFVDKLITMNSSTHFDYTYDLEAGFRVKLVGIKIRRLYIGPGYISLGLPSLANDREENSAALNLTLFRSRVIVSTSILQKKDNIINTQDGTTSTLVQNHLISFLITKSLQLSTGFMNTTQNKKSATDSLLMSSNNSTIFLGLNYRMRVGTRTIQVNTIYNRAMLKGSGILSNLRTSVNTGALNLGVTPLYGDISINVGIDNIMRLDSTESLGRTKIKMGLTKRSKGRLPSINLSLDYSSSESAKVIGVNTLLSLEIGAWGGINARGVLQNIIKENVVSKQWRVTVSYNKQFK